MEALNVIHQLLRFRAALLLVAAGLAKKQLAGERPAPARLDSSPSLVSGN